MSSPSTTTSPASIAAYVVGIIAAFMYSGVYLFDLSGAVMPSNVSGDVSVATGEAIFNGKGKCYTCHSIGGEGSAVRCPNLGVKAPDFMSPIGVRGGYLKPGVSAVEYIIESIYDPNAYVVDGFPGGVMKPINRPPIALSDDEITSVALFLLDTSGIETGDDHIAAVLKAQKPYRGAETTVANAGPAVDFPDGDSEDGFAVFEGNKCFQCHLVDGAEFDPGDLAPEDLDGGVGPELTSVGAVQDYEYLFESVVNPNAVVLPNPSKDKHYADEDGNSKMPDFLDSITSRELVDLVAYLKSLDGTRVDGSMDEDEDDEDEDEDDDE